METASSRRLEILLRYAKVALAAALPLGALALAYLVSVAIDVGVLQIGWFDRAWFGWTVVMPLLLAAPGLAGLARFVAGSLRQANAVVVVVSLFVAVFAAYRLTATLHQIGCQLVTDWIEAVPVSVAIGLTGGIAFGLAASGAGWAAARFTRQTARFGAALGAGAILGLAGGFATLLVFATLLPGVSCVPEPSAASASPQATASASPTSTTQTIGGFGWRTLPYDAFGGAQITAMAQLGHDVIVITNPFGVVIQEGVWPHPSLWRSADGFVWQELRDSRAFAGVPDTWIDTVSGVTGHGSGLIAVGAQYLFDASVANAEAWISADGTTWTRAVVSDGEDATMNFAYPVADGYVAIGTDGYSPHAGMQRGTAIWTSPDGARWSRLPSSAIPSGVAIAGVAAANGRFVAAGGDALAQGMAADATSLIWVSSDGIHFRAVPRPLALPSDAVLRGVAWTGSAFVAVGHHLSGGAFALQSSDGLSWRATALPASGAAAQAFVTAVTDTLFGLLVVGDALADASGSQGIAWISTDGTSWQLLSLPSEFRGVTLTQLLAAGNHLLVAGQTAQGAASAWLLEPAGH